MPDRLAREIERPLMTTIYLGLGSNLGDRRANLRRAIAGIQRSGAQVRRLSPVVESPAWLPQLAPEDWNRPFLNVTLEATFEGTLDDCLKATKALQRNLQPPPVSRWAPREIDIDLLLWGDAVINTPELTLPRPELTQLNFLLTPLLHLNPGLRIPGHDQHTVLELTRQTPPIPLWMAIINLTPDSFSDGGELNDWQRLEPHLNELLRVGTHIIDLGAESTRPGAQPLTAAREWARLAPALTLIRERLRDDPLRPQLSVDTYHPEVAEQALAAGVDMINDVGGLSDPAMLAIARDSTATWIAMHQLGLPADRQHVLAADADPLAVIEQWLLERLEHWVDNGIAAERIVLDPGIGFGKTGAQSLALLRRAAHLRHHGLRLLIGHSRKSYLRSFAWGDRAERDHATVGASLALCQQGVDILRVHNVGLHAAAYRGWAHVRGYQ